MKFNDIFVWNNRNKISIYSIFQDKTYNIETINHIYSFLNKNLGTDKKIILIREDYNISNIETLNDIKYNFPMGALFKMEFNLLKYCLNALILDFSKINRSLNDNSQVFQCNIICEKSQKDIDIQILEPLVKDNQLYRLLCSNMIQENKINFKVTDDYFKLKKLYHKKIEEINFINDKSKKILNKQLFNLNKQIDILRKKRINNNENYNRKKLIEEKMYALHFNNQQQLNKVKEDVLLTLTNTSKYILNEQDIENKMNHKENRSPNIIETTKTIFKNNIKSKEHDKDSFSIKKLYLEKLNEKKNNLITNQDNKNNLINKKIFI